MTDEAKMEVAPEVAQVEAKPEAAPEPTPLERAAALIAQMQHAHDNNAPITQPMLDEAKALLLPQ
jgi:hypothetical protein